MKKLGLILLSAAICASSVDAKSVMKIKPVTVAGYASSGNATSVYQTGQREVSRYLFSAFQRGFTEGNLQTNIQGGTFRFNSYLNHSYLELNRPGYSKVELYFQKDSRYAVRTANLSILEKLEGSQIGMLDIRVNGARVASNHSAVSYDRFTESSWDIASYLRNGLNEIEISLKFQQGRYGLMGVKVETRETLNQTNPVNNHYQNVQFVNNAFQRIHYRYPTQQELDYYVNFLDQGLKTSSEVEYMIRTLQQGGNNTNYQQLVVQYFQQYANRYPTQYEIQHYASKLVNGQITLPQLRAEIENLSGNNTGNVSINSRIRNTFYEILGRYPSTQELNYYQSKLQGGYLTWEQFRNEVILLKQQNGNVATGQGFTTSEVDALVFDNLNLNPDFFSRLRNTTANNLRRLEQRARFEQLHTQNAMTRNICQQIIQQIYRVL